MKTVILCLSILFGVQCLSAQSSEVKIAESFLEASIPQLGKATPTLVEALKKITTIKQTEVSDIEDETEYIYSIPGNDIYEFTITSEEKINTFVQFFYAKKDHADIVAVLKKYGVTSDPFENLQSVSKYGISYSVDIMAFDENARLVTIGLDD